MTKYGYVSISISMERQFHERMQVRVQNDGEYSEPFPVTNRDCDAGFPIRYRLMANYSTLEGCKPNSRC